MANCLTCGSETGDARYCTRCGSPTAQFPAVGSSPPPPPGSTVSMAALTGSPPPPPPPSPPPPPGGWPPGAWPPPAESAARRPGVALLAAGVAVLLVAAGVAGFLLLRPADGGVASVTDPVTSAAPLADQTPSSTARSTPAGGQAPGATAPSPAVSSVRTTPTSVGATPFVPVPTTAAADCSAPNSVDAAGATQTYEPIKAFDGKKETAWRCSGDAAGKTLVITFAAPVQLTSVGLIPGFDKIDPTDASDRFVQSRRVLRVKWTFDDGTSVESTPNGQRGMQTKPVSVRTGSVRMTIEQTTPGSTITNNKGESLAAVDTTAVSEIAFAGVQ